MFLDDLRNHCLVKKGFSEDFPFDHNTLVFRVFGKIFALMNVEPFESINLKCSPERALMLREQYAAILPGFHMNKKHWNTIRINEDVNDKLLLELIDHSYGLVFEGLPKKMKDEQSN